MSNQLSFSALKVVLKTHEDSLKKTRHVMEKRGKSHLKRVNRVFKAIALDDVEYVRDKLAAFKDEETTVDEERVEIVETLFEE